jgi:predicted Fe-S protein YdhL (DUF1289 family)
MGGEQHMISMCISACGNNGKFCPGCGRTMKDKMGWRNAVDDNDTETLERILAESKGRLDAKQYKYWSTMYEKKKARLGES